jgi:hypothetical protein
MRRRITIVVIVVVIIGLNACAPAPSTAMIPGMAQTLAVRTMVALQGISFFTTPTPTCTQLPPSSYNSADPHQALFTQPPTSSPVPSLTPFKVAVPSLLLSEDGCSNIAEFVKDVTIEDYSEIKPKQKFTKVWEVKNVGTCTWTTEYTLIFTEGDQLSGMSPMPLPREVKPEDTINLSIDLIAPRDSNIYQGNWMLQDAHGNLFGTGVAASDYFWVAIMVSSSTIGNFFGGGGCGGGG